MENNRTLIGKKKKSSALVAGVGTKGMKYSAKVDGKHTREYKLWNSMLQRCYSKRYQERYPAYIGTTCSENFKSYEYFYEWCQTQVGLNAKDEKGRYWHLDKDILIQNNKVYSEDTCVFVPPRINLLFVKCGRVIGDFPAGVCWDNRVNKFFAQCSDGGGKSKPLGFFVSKEEAFSVYKSFKESLVKSIALTYKDKVDKRVYQAMSCWEVVESNSTHLI